MWTGNERILDPATLPVLQQSYFELLTDAR